MTRIAVATPANYATDVRCTRVSNIQYAGDPLDMTALTASAGAPGATGWEVRKWLDGSLLTSGPWSGSARTIGTVGIAPFDKLGWLRFKLTGPDRGDGAFGSDYGTCKLSLFEDVAFIPKSALRTANPPNQAMGIDAPYLHGVCSLGGNRVQSLVNNLQINRQQAWNHAVGTSVTATLTSFGVTSASNLIAIHVVAGDATGMAPPAGWAVDQTVTLPGSVTMKIYRRYGVASVPFPITCTTANSADHSIFVTEVGPYSHNQMVHAVIASGHGNAVTLSDDLTAFFDEKHEYALIAAVGTATNVSEAQVSTPQLFTRMQVGNLLALENGIGGGRNQSVTFNLGAATDYVAVMIAYAGPSAPDTFGTFDETVVNTKAALDAWWDSWGKYIDANRDFRKVSVQLGVVQDYEGIITSMVAAVDGYKPGFIDNYTGRNEPGAHGFDPTEATRFATAVIAGSATAKPGGPDFVSMNNFYLNDFFATVDAGIFAPTGYKVLTEHGYNMGHGDIAETLSLMRTQRAGLVARGLQNLPIYMTEGGDYTTYIPGHIRVPQSGNDYMLQVVAREIVLKVPYERQYYFYDRRGGFDSEILWQSDNGGLYPGLVMHHAYAREIAGKTIEKELDFGSIGYICVGGVWRNPTDHTGHMVVIGANGLPAVTFVVYTTDGSPIPTSLTGVDCFGNPSTIALSGKTFTLTPQESIQGVRLPANVSVASRPVMRGTNRLAVPMMAITDSGDSAAAPARLGRIRDRSYLSPYASSSSDPIGIGNVYMTQNNVFPRTITLLPQFGAVVAADILEIYCPLPYQGMGLPLKGKIQYTEDGTTWLDPPTTVAQPAGGSWDNSATVTISNYDTAADTMVDAYSNPRHYFEFLLGSVKQLKGVRVQIDIPTRGMWIDSLMTNPPGSTVVIGDSLATVAVCISEIAARNSVASQIRPAVR